MADVAVEKKETPVVEEVDATIAKKIEAVATENGITDAEDGSIEAKENGSTNVAKAAVIAAEISPAAAAAVIPDAVVDSEMKNKIDGPAAVVAEKTGTSSKVASVDGVDAAAAAAVAIASDGKVASSEAVAEKSNGKKKDDADIAEAEPTEETNGDSSTNCPAEAVKRKIASEVDTKLDEAAAVTAEKKAKLEEAKEDVTNGGSDPTEIAA